MDDFGDLSPEGVAQKELEAREREICAFVRKEVEEQRASASRTAHESIWMNNIAAVLGLNANWNAQTRQYQQPVNRIWNRANTTPISVNKVLPTLQNRLAKLCKNPPRYDVRPESNDTKDKEAVRVGLDVLTWIWDIQGIDEKRINLMMWVQETGHAYLKVFWDPALGKEMMNPETGELDYEGDVAVSVRSSFEVFPDKLASSFEDLSHLTEARIRRLDYFRLQYGEKGAKVEAEDCWLLSLDYEDRIKSMNTRGPSTSGVQEKMKNAAIELIRYEKRSKEHPNGRMIVCANGVLLEDKPLPVGEIPFAKFDDVVVGGKYMSESIVTHIRPMQDQYNRVVQKRTDWTNKLLAGKYSAARGSGLTQESLTDQSGEVVYYDVVPNAPDGGRPVAQQIPMIPQYAYTEEDRIDNMINYVSGISDVSRGELPSAGIPAVGMQLLVEQDDSRIGIMTEQHERAYARVGSLILKYVSKYYTTARTIKIAGKQGYMVREVTGSMIGDNTDVIVVRGSTLPGSKVLRRQEIINLYTQGLLGDPNDAKVREKVLDALELGDVAEVWRKQSLDQYQVMLGLKEIERGSVPSVHKFDNHEYWIQQLNDYRIEKTNDLSIEQAAAIETCINEHLNMMLEISNVTADPPLPEPPPLPQQPQIPPLPDLMGASGPGALPPPVQPGGFQ